MGFRPDGAGGLALAGVSTAVSLLISSFCIYKHATNYTIPRIQRLIMRILFVCPVYSLGSVLSLRFPHASAALDTLRDIMEAFVIYSFLCLVLEYAGGDAQCVNRIKNEPPLQHPFPLCFLRPIHRDGRFLRICKQGTLQFVIVKPVMAVVTLIVISKGQYESAAYQAFQMVVYNVSYSMALYCLLLFYLGTRQILQRFSPVRKFLAVKSIIFATYWQSLLVRLWAGEAEAGSWNNLLLAVEMVPFSIFLGVAFSHTEYIRGMPDSSVLRSIKEVFSVRDVVQDAVHNFLPTYQDYVLQRPASPTSSGGGTPGGGGSGGGAAPKAYRARTFLAGNIDRWQLMDHDHLAEQEHEDGMMLEDDVSVDGSGTALGELRGVDEQQQLSPQRTAKGGARGGGAVGLLRSLSSSQQQQQPTSSSTARASPPRGGSSSSSHRQQQQQSGGREVDLISLQSPPPSAAEQQQQQQQQRQLLEGPVPTSAGSSGSPSKYVSINLDTP